ncbi:nucleotidyltransferase family protein [Candidatus Poribacteria bacterium]
MERDEIFDILDAHRDEIERFKVKSLALFGSVARNEARSDSDVDVLVEFAVPVGLFQFVRLKGYLEELLGAPVDLVTPDAIRDGMREQILKETIYAT